MEVGDTEFERFTDFMAKEREKLSRIEGRRLLRDARAAYRSIDGGIDRVRVAPDGKAASVDAPFAATNTFLPSTLMATQLRLASQYIRAADGGASPGLSSFVVLKAAIECTASAHWLMSGGSHRETVERVLKRMWWDTQAAAEMATIADEDTDLSSLVDLRTKIEVISRPLKGCNEESITGSTRVRLSGIVKDASQALRPDDPAAMYATWMLCAAVSHGNLPASAGAGLAPALIQKPSRHLIDESLFAHLLSVAVADLASTVDLFDSYATAEHSHRRNRQS